MPNKANKGLSASARRFSEDVARLLVPWGVPQAAARLYGYLLLNSGPVSLDRITADLAISKSSASVAARLLEQYMLVRRLGEPGSKRALYEVSENYEAMLTAQNRLLDALAELLRAGAGSVASGRAGERLEEMAGFYLVTREAMESALLRWRKRRGRTVSHPVVLPMGEGTPEQGVKHETAFPPAKRDRQGDGC